MYLENIKSPENVKGLSFEECTELAIEMREALIKKASVCGGHLGPNLGVVELSIALHRVFNSPKDKIVFDVSHQSYCHKMLTGRALAFIDEARYKDVSGYTNPDESEHDLFNIGHTATSISLACGLAKARDCAGSDENVIAVIGDGSLSGGEALEGLDFAMELGSNLIVIVNDNEMSIAEDHGGIYSNLKLLRDTKGSAECNIFKAFGFDYYYLEDGHNIPALCDLFETVKGIKRPVVLHVRTVKGKGYTFAETEKEDWHFRPPFHVENGDFKNHFSGENYDEIVSDYLLGKMKKDTSVVTLVAAVPLAIGFDKAKREDAGTQFVDVGIAEEHAIAMAAGIAKNGGKPVFATHSSFYQRTYDQISQEICINRLPVTLLVRNASVWGMNDITHLGIFDIPMISNIPNMVYLAPTNKEEYLAMLDWSIEQEKYPVAIRIPRNGVHYSKDLVDTDYSNINKYKIMQEGSEVAIVALGDFYQMGEQLSDLLMHETSTQPTLINPRYITGIDEEVLNNLLKQHKIVVTLEDGILDGGFGQKIASYYGRTPMKVVNYGLKKEFVDRYNPTELLKENHLTVDQMLEEILQIKGTV